MRWQRQLGAVACIGLVAAGSLPAGAAPPPGAAPPAGTAPPAAAGPAPELLAAYRVLDRLMAAAAVEGPITLVVRPFDAGSCGPSAATRPAADAADCLSGFPLPPRLQQGFFVAFVAALQRQSHPERDPQQLAAALDGRRILLHANGLVPAAPPSPAGGSLPPPALCRLAEAFAALQLNQPEQRRQGFDRIHTRLAERIGRIAERPRGLSFVEMLALNLATVGYFIPYGIVGSLKRIPSQNMGRWVNARLAESPHWQVLESEAPMVATALKALRGLPENSFFSLETPSPSFSDTWGRIDGWFGIAAQEREELIQAQRLQAQAEARRRLAAAGLDPGTCAAEFLPAAAEAAATPAAAAGLRPAPQARRPDAAAAPVLPHRFLPDGQTVVLFPQPARP